MCILLKTRSVSVSLLVFFQMVYCFHDTELKTAVSTKTPLFGSLPKYSNPSIEEKTLYRAKLLSFMLLRT